MLRFEVHEAGHATLPALDLADARVVIGSGPGAQLRLPATVARDVHVVIEGAAWRVLAAIVV
ncbi:MAG: hypothetical protein H0X17_05650, partial [Deltaproteobacteria bacterium]|nr:hypothetical protein [Deltaproteobacteria bacterium]